jgi:hypothetical protein
VPRFKQQPKDVPDPLAAVPRRRTGQAIKAAMDAEAQQAWGQMPLPTGAYACCCHCHSTHAPRAAGGATWQGVPLPLCMLCTAAVVFQSRPNAVVTSSSTQQRSRQHICQPAETLLALEASQQKLGCGEYHSAAKPSTCNNPLPK